MHHGRHVAAVALLTALGWSGGVRAQQHADHTDSPTSPEQEVTAVLEGVFEATRAGDFETLDRLYAGDDLTIVEGAGLDRGWANYRDHHLAPELAEFDAFEYTPHNIEVEVSGDMAWALFEYDLKIQMGERTVDRVGRGTAVFRRDGDRWVVRHMQTATRARN